MTDYTAQLLVPATLEIISNASPEHHVADGDANEVNLLQGPDFAKPNLVLDPEVQKMLDTIMALAPRHASMKSALKEYILSDKPLTQIANEHSYTPPALIYWIRKLGLPERPRRRPLLLEPTEQSKRIVLLVRQYGIKEAARRGGISRQRVSQIVCRWALGFKGRQVLHKVASLPKSNRRSPRNIVVSFRVSTDEWRRLLATKPTTGGECLSGFGKARAIVLRYLVSFDGDAVGPARSGSMAAVTSLSNEVVNVYTEKAA